MAESDWLGWLPDEEDAVEDIVAGVSATDVAAACRVLNALGAHMHLVDTHTRLHF
jgi:hypothetical protein